MIPRALGDKSMVSYCTDRVLSEWAWDKHGKERTGETKEAFLERENLGMVQTGLEESVLSMWDRRV